MFSGDGTSEVLVFLNICMTVQVLWQISMSIEFVASLRKAVGQ